MNEVTAMTTTHADLTRIVFTADLKPEFADEVIDVMSEAAEDVNGRLTRADYQFTGEADEQGRKLMRLLRRKTIRKP